MNIVEKLTTLGVEVTPEIEKAFSGNFVSEQEMAKKISKVEAERDQFKAQFETAQETLKGFEGKDFDAITRECADWKAKAEASEKNYAEQIAKRDYMDALTKRVDEVQFSSNSAKKSFLNDLELNPLQVRDGNILGFDDYLKAAMESDPTAFVTDTDKGSAKFTNPMNQGNAGQAEAPKSAIPTIF